MADLTRVHAKFSSFGLCDIDENQVSNRQFQFPLKPHNLYYVKLYGWPNQLLIQEANHRVSPADGPRLPGARLSPCISATA